ncbi:MAG: dipeptide ABC transporter ATP-binding protein [Acinetobacter populi]|jgi:microcin C transport system ATP-binding protein|uniref:ABC transporter ATP-binding protein n=1 Tax=Acinetobacter populi TaxID=1582270 RepID=UPI0023523BFD|nr:dipeptide ABC transporter ATP-binding protein [Acinetobacter populi]MCH4246572.1 dipeptide ABC transporter ATP-binding protein [Acinetobacter populi]
MHSIQDNAKAQNNQMQDNISAENALLHVEQLKIQHEQHTLVHDLSFELHRGQTLAIVGESGSGKSISSLAILGLLPANLTVSGQIKLDHQDLCQFNQQQWQHIRGQKIAMIFQEPMTALNPLHRVEKLIGESLLLQGLSTQQVRQRVIALLSDVGIPDPEQKLKRYPHELSGGQRQRVMIAMALALDPEILIADEPTTALDVTLQEQVLQLLKSLQQQRNMAMILISHDLKLVGRFSDQVIVMQKGIVKEQGLTQAIFNNPQDAYTKNLLDHDFGEALQVDSQHTVLQLTNLQVRYPIKTGLFNRIKDYVVAVEPITLDLKQGESIGIVGESGSGKTSLALAIARLIDSDGQIQLENLRLDQLSEKYLRPYRHQFQIVFQDPFSSLNPRMNVEQIVGEGLEIQGVVKSEISLKVEEVLQRVDLPAHFSSRYPHELSGGQRQRVALARALILRPKLIILDEATSALDRTTQRAMLKLLRALQQEFQFSYLFISHDLAVVRALCQRILVLHHGKMVEFQHTAQLFTQPQDLYTQKLIEASLLTM